MYYCQNWNEFPERDEDTGDTSWISRRHQHCTCKSVHDRLAAREMRQRQRPADYDDDGDMMGSDSDKSSGAWSARPARRSAVAVRGAAAPGPPGPPGGPPVPGTTAAPVQGGVRRVLLDDIDGTGNININISAGLTAEVQLNNGIAWHDVSVNSNAANGGASFTNCEILGILNINL